jgi:hypothetical protein
MPPNLAARYDRLRGEPTPFRIEVVFIQLCVVFEDIPQAGQDGLVGAAGRLVDAFPIARARLPGKAADKAGGQDAAREVAFRSVTRKTSREIAADRRNRRARDIGIRTGPEDFADDHRNLSRLTLSSHPGRMFIAIEFVLNVSLLKKIFVIARESTFRQPDVNDLSYSDLALQHEICTFVLILKQAFNKSCSTTTLVA